MEGLFEYFIKVLKLLKDHEFYFAMDYLTIAIIAISVIINNILLFFSTEIKNHFKKKVIPYMATRIGFVKTELTKKISLIDGIKFIFKSFKDGFNKGKNK